MSSILLAGGGGGGDSNYSIKHVDSNYSIKHVDVDQIKTSCISPDRVKTNTKKQQTTELLEYIRGGGGNQVLNGYPLPKCRAEQKR